MTHPLVSQLRFTRSEFKRAITGVSEADARRLLNKVRLTIRYAAPEAKETNKYQIPTFTQKGNLISFAMYKKHIALYPAPEGDGQFNRELSAYKAEKSTVRFPLDQLIPYDLISRIVKYRIENNLRRAAVRAKRK